MSHADALDLPGLAVRAGHRLVSLALRPDLRHAMGVFNGAVWPTFMLQDPVADDGIAATSNAAPIAWDGTDAGLPHGWDDQLLRTVAGLTHGSTPTTLGAFQIVVDPGRQGGGLSGVMLGAMHGQARSAGYHAVIACVRPTWKDRYPLVSIERYATWRRDDGLPFDPWIRLHERTGGRVSRPEPRSMTIPGSIADRESWTGMSFPETGEYVVPGAAALVSIARGTSRPQRLDDPRLTDVRRSGTSH